jgi:4-alpha-glucanotransferase
MPRDFFAGRHAGLLVPLFSIPSRSSWGIGELSDLPILGRWMQDAGFSFVQLLPLNEMASGQHSPYSALSAMAIDPIFISPALMVDFGPGGAEARLDASAREALAAARAAATLDYTVVRALKERVFRAAFDRFERDEWQRRTARASMLQAFIDREAWWLREYGLFRALKAHEDGRHWLEWPAPFRDRTADALAEARSRLAREVLFYVYLQWIAAGQWQQARADAGVGVFGDFPFMVSSDSADVWSRQQDFRLDASVGAPPDAFSETGQDWGFPAYRGPEIAATGDEWLRARARRSANLYDGYRVDHLVGFFRTYVRERDGSAGFVPPSEGDQIAQGARLLALFTSTGARVTAEDLGVIPDFVRQTLGTFRIPGYKVLRWEREWNREGQPFKDPRAYTPTSIATSGTHDTETLAEWWESVSPEERVALAALESLRAAGLAADAGFSDRVRDAFLTALFGAGSDLLIVPVQDIFGWRDRINTPALISDTNWSWRLRWPVDDLQREAAERAGFLRALSERSGRSGGRRVDTAPADDGARRAGR